MSDGRAGDTISRAEYGRFTHELANYQQGNLARLEREERRRLRAENQERLRQRGQALREAQKRQLQTTAAMVGEKKLAAHAVGSELRQHRIELRARRQQQQHGWERHGYSLTQKYSTKGMTESKRRAKAAHEAERAKEATEMKNSILAANKATDERVRKEIDDMAERVRKENDHTVTRHAKQAFVNERWDAADAVRERLDLWRRQRKAQELGYLQTAVALQQSLSSPEPMREARRKAEAQRGAVGEEMRHQRAKLKQQHRAQEAQWKAKQDANHEARQAARVATEEVKHESDASWSGYDPILRFFGFRKRGGPEKATYQASYGGEVDGDSVYL